MHLEAITLLQFLEQTGAQVHAYDIGRRVGTLTREQFLAFEEATAPYPLPMQRKAWFALVQQPPGEPANPVIWFLRLDLDEQGLLVQAGRDYVLSRLLESAQAQTRGADPQAFLQDNPYAFTPREDRMALFHALLSANLELPLRGSTNMPWTTSEARQAGTSGASWAIRASRTSPAATTMSR